MLETLNFKFVVPEMNSDAKKYFAVHKERYTYLFNVVKKLRKRISADLVTIIDIGPSLFTKLLEQNFPDDSILSLGLEHETSRGGHLPHDTVLEHSKFIEFNLNDIQYPDRWVSIPQSEIVVLAEVIEHLYTSPKLVLKFLNTFIKPNGYLVIQTPNAAALKNRISLLLGRNPFHLIRENADNPGHFREYTIKELIVIAEETGYTIEEWSIQSYFNPRNWIEKLYVSITKVLPPKFRDGVTIVLRKK